MCEPPREALVLCRRTYSLLIRNLLVVFAHGMSEGKIAGEQTVPLRNWLSFLTSMYRIVSFECSSHNIKQLTEDGSLGACPCSVSFNYPVIMQRLKATTSAVRI